MKTSLTLATLLAFGLGCDAPPLEMPGGPAVVAEQTAPEESTTPEADAAPFGPREATGRDPKKGKLSREQGGYLGSVLGAGMYAQHQAIFLQVKQAINLDYGLNGDFAKSHEEFMERVIKFNKIQLPELDEGDEYLYDPEDHTLKIYRPEK